MESLVFYSRKSLLTSLLFGGTALVLLGVGVLALLTPSTPALWLPVLIPAAGMAWIWFDTRYIIDGPYLYYQSGPFRGQVAIADIRSVVVNKTLWVGFRPALATGGLIIRYNRWDEIYISPRNPERFLAVLTERNPRIECIQ